MLHLLNFLAKNRDRTFFTRILIQSTQYLVSDVNGDDSNLKPLNDFVLFPYLKRKSEKKNNLSRSVKMCYLEIAKDGNCRVTMFTFYTQNTVFATGSSTCKCIFRCLGWGLRFNWEWIGFDSISVQWYLLIHIRRKNLKWIFLLLRIKNYCSYSLCCRKKLPCVFFCVMVPIFQLELLRKWWVFSFENFWKIKEHFLF